MPNTSGPDGERVVLDEDAHAHRGHHFTLVVWPNGKAVLATPDWISRDQFEAIQELMANWMESDGTRPLIIGQCKVVMSPVSLTSVELEDEDDEG